MFFNGCSAQKSSLEQAVTMREQLLNANGCSFKVTLTADYQDVIYTFRMECTGDKEGNVVFEVVSPETISGVTGRISGDRGELIFDEHALLFSKMIDGQITPVCGPWIFLKTLRSGYIEACRVENDGLFVQFSDSYEGESFMLNVITKGNVPVFSELIWEERRILAIEVEEYCVL